MRKRGLLLIGLALCAVVTTAAQAPKKVLYLTYSAGYRHDVIPLSMQILPEIGKKNGFDVVATKDLAFLTPEELKKYDGVVFYTTGELPISDADKANLLAWVKSGKAFIGIHCATDTFYKWPEYGEMIGGYFDGHPWHQEVKVKVEDANTQATRALPNPWVLTDEIYQFRNWDRSKLHVLLSLDTSTVDLKKNGVKRTDGDFANAWTKTYGDGRVFYSALGHRAELWQSPEYQQFLAGGIRWALGLE
jgi:type 1 glutamine amidotransferase